MRFDVLTLFPEMFEAVLGNSITGRARKAGLIEMNFINIRDFANNKHNSVDDTPYSGGGGMIMQAEPVYNAYMSVAGDLPYKPFTIYMSPQGKTFDQQCAREFSKEGHIILICGHYEGLDQRLIDEIVDEEISIGNYVLTGGEIPAMAVIDATSRMIKGVLADENSYENESHFGAFLEHPQYTRPAEWHGKKVPEVLLSGDHKKILAWKHKYALITTYEKRPDMLDNAYLTDEDIKIIEEHKKQKK